MNLQHVSHLVGGSANFYSEANDMMFLNQIDGW
jgi:hypothetical protein